MDEDGFGHGVGMLVRGLMVGAVAMYLLDPDKGRRRRAVARDKLRRFGNDAERLAQQATCDLRNRLHGMNAALARRSSGIPADELKVIERVRSALGRYVAHPHAVQVGARGGTIVLSGPVLATEVPGLLAAVHGVPGVAEVENHLDVHVSDDGVPSLQGVRRRGRRASAINTPAARLAMLVGGGVLATYGLAKRGAGGLALVSAGVGMAVRAVDQETANALAALARSGMSTSLGARDAYAAAGEAAQAAAGANVGADGTPTGTTSAAPRSAAPDLAGGASDVPLIGNDGTRSASVDPRTSAARSGDGGLDAASPLPARTGERPPL